MVSLRASVRLRVVVGHFSALNPNASLATATSVKDFDHVDHVVHECPDMATHADTSTYLSWEKLESV